MKLDIELLNRLKEELAENNGVSWYDFTPSRHERNWEEVCLRYSEEVNKKLIQRQRRGILKRIKSL